MMIDNSINNFFNYKIYRFTITSFLFSFNSSSVSYWLSEHNQLTFLKFNTLSYLKEKFNWNYIKNYLKKFIEHFSIFVPYFKFKWFRFVLFSGLGYKRKFLSKLRIMFAYIADRHWILYNFNSLSSIISTKKRNFIFLASAKGWFSKDYGYFSNLRNPYVYKTKGFLDIRVKKRFLFARRIKFKTVKPKLSKKQQLL